MRLKRKGRPSGKMMMTEFHKPTPTERIESSAKSLARDLVEDHPMMVKMRNQAERKLTRAAGSVARSLRGRR